MSSSSSSSSSTSQDERTKRIQQRFESQFLPRYGNVWRQMVQTKKKQHDFLNAIEQKTSIQFQVSTVQHVADGCDCEGGCAPPILELEDSDTENNKPTITTGNTIIGSVEKAQYRWKESEASDESSSSSSESVDSSDEHFIDDDDASAGSVKEHVATTPLPSDLNEDFGKFLTFGEEDDHTHKSSQIHDDNDDEAFEDCISTMDKSDDDDDDDDDNSTDTKVSGRKPAGLDVSHPLDSSPTKTKVSDVEQKKNHGVSIQDSTIQPANAQFVIDLMDSDDDDDDDDDPTSFEPYAAGSRRLSPGSTKPAVEELVDSSDESVEVRKPPPRAKKPIQIKGDDSSEDCEWSGGGSSNSEPSFDSPEELDDSDDDKANQRRKSISKLAKGARHNSASLEVENLHPNKKVVSKKATMSAAAFKKNRETLSTKYFEQVNAVAFGNLLSSVDVVWSNKLRTTAGQTRLRKRQLDFSPGSEPIRLATIELSTKILDDPERLESTLVHEACHAAAWIIDGVSKPPHGTCFKKWANTAMRNLPGIQVTTTHDYKIQYKYAWACTNPNCTFLVQRHSRSIDLERKCCGRCRGRLIEVDVPDSSSSKSSSVQRTPKKRAPPSGYNLFVKEKSKAVRERLAKQQGRTGKVTQADVMKECARLWQEQKQYQGEAKE